MTFMTIYKKLDKKIKDSFKSEAGISKYLSVMNNCKDEYKSLDWDTVYLKLKRYRHIRNQISHNPEVNEEDVCTPSDIAWLEEFYEKFMTRMDPLGVYYQNMMASREQQYEKGFFGRIIDKIKSLFN